MLFGFGRGVGVSLWFGKGETPFYFLVWKWLLSFVFRFRKGRAVLCFGFGRSGRRLSDFGKVGGFRPRRGSGADFFGCPGANIAFAVAIFAGL